MTTYTPERIAQRTSAVLFRRLLLDGSVRKSQYTGDTAEHLERDARPLVDRGLARWNSDDHLTCTLPPRTEAHYESANLLADMRAVLNGSTDHPEAARWLKALDVDYAYTQALRDSSVRALVQSTMTGILGVFQTADDETLTVQQLATAAPARGALHISVPEIWDAAITALTAAQHLRADDNGQRYTWLTKPAPAPVEEAESGVPHDGNTAPATLADRIIAALKESGKADNTALAKQLGVHYTDVMGALRELASAGKVEKIPGSLDWKLATAEGTGVSQPKTAETNTPAPAPAPTKAAPAKTPVKDATPKAAPAKGEVSQVVSQTETAPVTIGETILDEVRELRRDLRQALAPVTAPKTDPESAEELLAASDVMTVKVLVRVIVCLHVYGEMTRTALRGKLNGKRLYSLPEAIALGLRLGVVDANAQDGYALRLIDHLAVVSNAELELLAAEQRARDKAKADKAKAESNGLLGGLAHAARTLAAASR